MNQHYSLLFRENDIDGKSLMGFKVSDFESMGIADEHNRFKLAREVDKIINNNYRMYNILLLPLVAICCILL